jgi:integrase
MGRHPEGLKIVWRGGYAHARFTWQKRREFISTGERDPARAQVKAEQIYAEVIGGKRRRVSAAVRVLQPLDKLFAEWLATLEGVLDVETIKTYRVTYVATHFLSFFRSFERVCDESAIDAYTRERIRKVLRRTLQKELGALKGFLRWCKMEGFIDALPRWPEMPRTAKGKRVGKQRAKANELSEEQVVSAIMSMPELSARISKADRRRFVVRPRFVVAYETGLRPATIDTLSIPEHWRPGSSVLVVADEHDKARYGRRLTLTASAKAALERTCELLGIKAGVIFGRHDYRSHLAKAGVEKLAAYDFRHARATHMLDRGASLSGVAYNHGHRQTTTTSKYTHPTRRAGDAALEVGGADLTGAVPDQEDQS